MKYPLSKLSLAVLTLPLLLLGGCNDGKEGAPGSNGDNGANGANGANGNNGLASLVRQYQLPAGSIECNKGGVVLESGLDENGDGTLDADEVGARQAICNSGQFNTHMNFNRVATFPVCAQKGSSCTEDAATTADTANTENITTTADTTTTTTTTENITTTENTTTAAEIVATSTDGMTLIYSNSPAEQVGFIDISNPAFPVGLGALELGNEPTSVAVAGAYVLVGVNRSANYIDVAGSLEVVDIATRSIVHSIDLGGQPDSIAVSPDGQYAVVVIENERDENFGDGAPPQLPAGNLIVVQLVGAPATWTTRTVDLTGLADLYPGDPEPEYVDINHNNLAVVSLQENNHLVLVDLVSAEVFRHFSAGTVDLMDIDDDNESPALISLNARQDDVPREPDGVAWINNDYFATADEGDLDGGSRGFTVFNLHGEVVYTSGNTLDHMAVRLGHYPDDRSDNKGNEPENVEVGIYGGERYLFVASERASLIFVYDAADPLNPVFKQALPAAAAPEGVLAIPSRNLLITASEEDSRQDTLRSGVNIYSYTHSPARYPTIRSADRSDGKPIPWGALSGLAADRHHDHILYAVDDSYYQRNRIFTLDISHHPALLAREIYLRDTADVLAALPTATLADVTVPAKHVTRAEVFDEADLSDLINADKTINIDPEGIAHASDGGFWIASEGDGTLGDAQRPINSVNMVLKTDAEGVIEKVFTLPEDVNASQIRFGFEGIAEAGDLVYVAFQRAWTGDTQPRIGVLDPTDGSWSFYFYPLDTVASPNGGWVGLSDLTALGNGEFLVIERDNQAGPDAAVKKLYRFSVEDMTDGDTIRKTLVRDLLSDLRRPGGMILEKIEGSAVAADGTLYIVNDNDGIDGSNGETQLLNLGRLAE